LKRQTQTILYHTLPIAFWLLAVVGSALPFLFLSFPLVPYLCPALLALVSVMIIRHIKRHSSSVEQCFQVAVLLGITSYWLPTVVLLILPVWIYLVTRNIFSLRSFLSTLLGLALVAVWMAVFSYLGIIETPSLLGRAGVGYWPWLPTGAVLIAYIASTIVRQNLRVR
jgi:MFS family permease